MEVDCNAPPLSTGHGSHFSGCVCGGDERTTSTFQKYAFLDKVVRQVSALLPVTTGSDRGRDAAQPLQVLELSSHWWI
jgi:hypothetical protein